MPTTRIIRVDYAILREQLAVVDELVACPEDCAYRLTPKERNRLDGLSNLLSEIIQQRPFTDGVDR